MFHFIPTKAQWRAWSLPSKLTCIGAYLGALSIFFTIAIFAYQMFFPQSGATTLIQTGNGSYQAGHDLTVYNGVPLTKPSLSAAKPPEITPFFKIMPFDPPYPPGLVVAGIRFRPHMLDVRFFLSIEYSSVKNLDVTIRLINTSGQLLSIIELAQQSTFSGTTIIPIINNSPHDPPITIKETVGDKNTATVPIGSVSSFGKSELVTDTWRIHCAELLWNTTAEFVLMVNKPYRTKMIEGFIVNCSYDYDLAGETKTARFTKIVAFDDFGNSHIATHQEAERIRNYKTPDFKLLDTQIYYDSTNALAPPNLREEIISSSETNRLAVLSFTNGDFQVFFCLAANPIRNKLRVTQEYQGSSHQLVGAMLKNNTATAYFGRGTPFKGSIFRLRYLVDPTNALPLTRKIEVVDKRVFFDGVLMQIPQNGDK